ncbi:MAG: iron chelate uptake ABC transporter family permease subunit [Candidatus Margulisiibacteriota bacterium]
MTIIFDYPLIIALIGASFIGVSSGIISCYAVLKEQSLLGDAIAHAALPGICIAFLITLSKSPGILISGALAAGFLGMLLITTIIRKSILKEDTALGIILSVFFGIGTLLLTIIQKIPTARQAGLDTYLFGNAASILYEDLKIIVILTISICFFTILFWKEFKAIIFDSDHTQTQGFPVFKIELILTTLMVVAIIIGLQTVGVILMSALIIAPAIAAKQWFKRFAPVMVLSIIFSVTSCILGVLLSSSINHLPSGPTIVIFISGFVLISLLFSPRGIISSKINEYINNNSIRAESILSNLYLLAKTHKDHTHPHDINTLNVLGGIPTQKLLVKLKKDGLIYQKESNLWGLTNNGIEKAIQILQRVH